jgi:hypothetical protein
VGGKGTLRGHIANGKKQMGYFVKENHKISLREGDNRVENPNGRELAKIFFYLVLSGEQDFRVRRTKGDYGQLVQGSWTTPCVGTTGPPKGPARLSRKP